MQTENAALKKQIAQPGADNEDRDARLARPEKLLVEGHRAARPTANPRSSFLKIVTISLAVEIWLIYEMSAHGNFLQRGEAGRFVGCGFAAGAAYWVAARCFARTGWTIYRSTGLFWLAAIALRMAVLPVLPGDDLWRYRWEGTVQWHGFNPYQTAPADPALTRWRDPDWSRINHRDYAAVYPPLAEAAFAGLAGLGNSVWLYKFVFALADLAGVAILRRLLAGAGRAVEEAAWYAWNPLAIYAFAGAAHFDSLMILALLGAVWALDRCRRVTISGDGATKTSQAFRWGGLSALLLGVAIALKIAPLALLPVWACAFKSWRRSAVLLPLALLPLTAGALAYGYPGVPVFATLRQFGSHFRVNDPVWWLVDWLRHANPTGDNTLYGGCASLICAGLAYGFRSDWRRGLLWVWGAALLLSPVVHAWYVVWVLPIAAWRGESARGWFVFSISSLGYYLLWEVNYASGKPWEEPLWLRLSILLPPLLAVVWTYLSAARKASFAENSAAVVFRSATGDDAGQ